MGALAAFGGGRIAWVADPDPRRGEVVWGQYEAAIRRWEAVLGNGVVPQQAAHAIRALITDRTASKGRDGTWGRAV